MIYSKPVLREQLQDSWALSSALTQLYSFTIDMSECDPGGDMQEMVVVDNVMNYCAQLDDENFMNLFLGAQWTMVCAGDENEYPYTFTSIVPGGTMDCDGDGETSAIYTLDLPEGAPEGTCVVEHLTVQYQGDGGDMCEGWSPGGGGEGDGDVEV